MKDDKRYTLKEVAKILGGNIEVYSLIEVLSKGYIIDEQNIPSKKYIDEGLLAQGKLLYEGKTKVTKRYQVLVIGQKGIDFIRAKLIDHAKYYLPWSFRKKMWSKDKYKRMVDFNRHYDPLAYLKRDKH